jgi:hypothetical protein
MSHRYNIPLLKRATIILLYLFEKSFVVIGMFISLLAVIVAAVVEHFRLEIWNQGYDIQSTLKIA